MSTIKDMAFSEYLNEALKDPQTAVGFIEETKADPYPNCVYKALVKVFNANPNFLPMFLPVYAKDLSIPELKKLLKAYPEQAPYFTQHMDALKAIRKTA